MLGVIATHVFIPALPAAAQDLHASPGAIQLTVTLYLVGMATGQLFYGPLSDRFGRRPVVLAGLTLYVLASAFAAVAGSIGILLLARVLQALGGCSCLVLGRAMARDGTSTERAAGRLGIVVAAMAIGPALAPSLGGLLSAWLGWRAIFVALALLGTIVLLAVTLTLPESHRRLQPLPGIRPMLQAFRRLLGLRAFRGYALGGCFVSTSLYAFFSSSPFLFGDVLQQGPRALVLYYLLVLTAVSGSSFAAGPLARRFGMLAIAKAGNALMLAGGATLVAVDLGGVLNVPSVMIPIMLISIGCGIASPMGMAGAIGADDKAIGTASGLYGSMQMIYGALCTIVVSQWHTGTALPMATVFLVSALAGMWAFGHAGTPPKAGR